jgi:hypothetical protein
MRPKARKVESHEKMRLAHRQRERKEGRRKFKRGTYRKTFLSFHNLPGKKVFDFNFLYW